MNDVLIEKQKLRPVQISYDDVWEIKGLFHCWSLKNGIAHAIIENKNGTLSSYDSSFFQIKFMDKS